MSALCFASQRFPSCWRRLLATALASAALLCGGSCVQEEESVLILGVPKMGEGGGEGQLECSAVAGGQEWMQGIRLDLSFKTGLTLPVELQNNIIRTTPEASNAGIDHSELRLRSADVSLRIPQLPAVEDAVRAVNPDLLDFNLPLPTVSVEGGGSRKVIFLEIPSTTLDPLRDAMEANGFVDATEVMMLVTSRLHFDLSGGFGTLQSREFTVPVNTAVGNLRVCMPTSWVDPADAEAEPIELCTPENCQNSNPSATNVCGNAQIVGQAPRCCDGPEAWAKVPNAPEICGISL